MYVEISYRRRNVAYNEEDHNVSQYSSILNNIQNEWKSAQKLSDKDRSRRVQEKIKQSGGIEAAALRQLHNAIDAANLMGFEGEDEQQMVERLATSLLMTQGVGLEAFLEGIKKADNQSLETLFSERTADEVAKSLGPVLANTTLQNEGDVAQALKETADMMKYSAETIARERLASSGHAATPEEADKQKARFMRTSLGLGNQSANTGLSKEIARLRKEGYFTNEGDTRNLCEKIRMGNEKLEFNDVLQWMREQKGWNLRDAVNNSEEGIKINANNTRNSAP